MEFAFVLPVLIGLLYGLISVGDMLFKQQAVSRSVQAGALAVALLPPPSVTPPAADPIAACASVPARYLLVCGEVTESLANSSVVPRDRRGSIADSRAWAQANLLVEMFEENCPASIEDCLRIRLAFPYGNDDGTRPFRSITIPGMGSTEAWMPDTLIAEATVRL